MNWKIKNILLGIGLMAGIGCATTNLNKNVSYCNFDYEANYLTCEREDQDKKVVYARKIRDDYSLCKVEVSIKNEGLDYIFIDYDCDNKVDEYKFRNQRGKITESVREEMPDFYEKKMDPTHINLKEFTLENE